MTSHFSLAAIFMITLPVLYPIKVGINQSHWLSGILLPLCSQYNTTEVFMGKIQGDGQKFLDRFKSYFGSQILSQSLNEIHIYWLQAKSATKDDFLFRYFWLFLSVRFGACCPLTFDLVTSNNVNASLVPILARQSYSWLNVVRLQFLPYIFCGF